MIASSFFHILKKKRCSLIHQQKKQYKLNYNFFLYFLKSSFFIPFLQGRPIFNGS